jgi:transposase
MTQAGEALLPDDLETLKAMLIAERQRAERLVQIIKDLQRHRFGRRAESLPEDQLLLALEDAEQGKAEAAAETEAKSMRARAEGARKRRANRGALPAICRASSRSSTSRTRPARAARGRCTGSART